MLADYFKKKKKKNGDRKKKKVRGEEEEPGWEEEGRAKWSRGPDVIISVFVLVSQHVCNRITIESQVTHSNTRKDRADLCSFLLPGLYCRATMKPLNPDMTATK